MLSGHVDTETRARAVRIGLAHPPQRFRPLVAALEGDILAHFFTLVGFRLDGKRVAVAGFFEQRIVAGEQFVVVHAPIQPCDVGS